MDFTRDLFRAIGPFRMFHGETSDKFLGGTGGALRAERSGITVGGKVHTIKAGERIAQHTRKRRRTSVSCWRGCLRDTDGEHGIAKSARRVSTKMKLTKKSFVGFVLALCGGGLLFLGSLVWKYKRFERAYDALLPGTPRAEVLRQVGKPTEKRPCTLKPSWDAEPLHQKSGTCAEELWYFSRISPEQWVVGLDGDGKTVTKYHLVSP